MAPGEPRKGQPVGQITLGHLQTEPLRAHNRNPIRNLRDAFRPPLIAPKQDNNDDNDATYSFSGRH